MLTHRYLQWTRPCRSSREMFMHVAAAMTSAFICILASDKHHTMALAFSADTLPNKCRATTAQVKAILELATYLQKELCKRAGDIRRRAPEEFLPKSGGERMAHGAS